MNRKTPANFTDLTGRTFGSLTVASRAPNYKSGASRWHCVCACGTVKTFLGNNLIRGDSRSCRRSGCPLLKMREAALGSEYPTANIAAGHRGSAGMRAANAKMNAERWVCRTCDSAAMSRGNISRYHSKPGCVVERVYGIIMNSKIAPEGGRISGETQGRRNVESGHLARVSSAGGKKAGPITCAQQFMCITCNSKPMNPLNIGRHRKKHDDCVIVKVE